jgi:DNA-binding cell septation regulator SpoVG
MNKSTTAPEKAKPAGSPGGNRSVVVTEFRSHVKNTLRGFLSCELPSGMIVHGLAYHEKNQSRWVGMPSQQWLGDQGNKQYSPVIEFASREVANKFRDAVLSALDEYLEESKKGIESATPR